MKSGLIKNVVFDIGNVFVRWSPLEIIRLTFGDLDKPEQLAISIFQSEIWMNLNKGLISEKEAKVQYQICNDLTELDCETLFYYIKQTQILVFGTVDLLKRVKAAGYNVYALTDNVHEIVDYLNEQYNFWTLFDGKIVSADVGALKPQPEIYQALFSQYNLEPEESVFIDDMLRNIEGANSVGMSAIEFKNVHQCEKALKDFGLSF